MKSLPYLCLLLFLGSAIVQAQHLFSHWAEGTRADDDGATRDYYNRAGLLAWGNFMGDWRDANDAPQGEAAYALTTLIDDDTPEYIQWDATSLVQEWIDETYPNKGMFLRGVSGGGAFHFYSREHPDPARRPYLIVVTANRADTLSPARDVYLDPTTYQCFGDMDKLTISSDKNTLLWFDLSGIPAGTPILSATLMMFVYAEYGSGSMDAGVFRCSQSHESPPAPPILGLAAQYPNDQGIGGDPAVHLFSDFESTNWGNDWTYGTDAVTLELIASDPVRLFAPWQGEALRVKIPRGGNTGMNVGFNFAPEIGYEPESIYLRYYLRISDDWNTSEGGKLPGMAGTYGVAGWGGRKSDGYNGWSARGCFYVNPPGGNPLEGIIPTGNYVYHADMQGFYGDIHLWQDDYRGYLEKNRWYCIEQYLQLNTPMQNDGVLRTWVDGRLAYQKTDWRWRDTTALKIEQVWMNVYHGGTAPVPEDVFLYIDNVVIADQYIGPMVSPTGLE